VLAPALIEFLQESGTGVVRHGEGRSLLAHLQGTARIVTSWDQPETVQRAALFHSVYGTDSFRRTTLALEERARLRAMIGDDAERLVYLFCVLSRVDLRKRLRESGARAPLRVRHHASPDTELLGPREICALVILHLANLAEQARSPGGGPPPWLAAFGRLAAYLCPEHGTLPPLLATGFAPLDDAAEAALLLHYADALRALRTDPAAAQAELHACLDIAPWLAEPHAWLAYDAAVAGERELCRRHLALAHPRFERFGTSWDKRLELDQWFALLGLVNETADGPEAPDPFDIGETEAATFQNIRAALGVRPPPDFGRERFTQFIETYADPKTNRGTTVYPGLRAKPWHEPAGFPIVAALEAASAAISAELAGIGAGAFHREAEPLERDGAWDVFMLYERGIKQVDNCARCPETTRIVEGFDTVRTLSGLVYFSRLRPGTHIKAHRGPTNLRVRCHLGLVVPEGDCALRVASETRRWKAGACLTFEDFFEHEAWNHASGERLVLVVDLWHPDLSPTEVRLLSGFQDRVLWQARNLHQYWDNNARARANHEGGGSS